jgi:hypothetical protein
LGQQADGVAAVAAAAARFYGRRMAEARELAAADLADWLAERSEGMCRGAGAEARGECGRDIYRLGRGYKGWHLAFRGVPETLGDKRAVHLVEYLLKHPLEGAIHATVLENRVDGNPVPNGMIAVEPAGAQGDAQIGGVVVEGAGKRLGGRITLPALKAKLADLRAARADETLPESERNDAARDLSNLLRAHGRGGKLVGGGERAVDRVRKQIKAFIEELKAAEVTKGEPNIVLRDFGQHLEEYLWRRSLGAQKRLGASAMPGCFTYEPPPGVRWAD